VVDAILMDMDWYGCSIPDILAKIGQWNISRSLASVA